MCNDMEIHTGIQNYFLENSFLSIVECSELASLPSGKAIISNNGTTTRAMFTCDTGYYLDGLTELYCLPDGTWDSVLPTCSK